MTRRDLYTDLDMSQPLSELEAARAEVAADPRVWHALLLPIKVTHDPRFVLTGHNVCHDCALCHVAGDFRDGGHLVPWREVYPDCTSTEAEIEEYATCADDIVGKVRMPNWVIESLHAAFGTQPAGHSGWRLDPARLEALDAWGQSLPAVAASRLSGAYMLIDSLFGVDEAAPLLPPEVHLPPWDAPGEPGAAATAEPSAVHSALFHVYTVVTAARVDFPGLRALCAEGYSLDVQQITWAHVASLAAAALPAPLFETLTTWTPLGQGHPAVPYAVAIGALAPGCVTFAPGQLVIPAGERLWGLLFHGGDAPLPEGDYICTLAFIPRRAVAVE